MDKERKSALQLAEMIREYTGEPALRIGVFFDKTKGWRANVYTDPKDLSAKQARVDEIVQDMRNRYSLYE
jgi:hypothetical protein